MHDLMIAVEGRSHRFLARRCGERWAAVATRSSVD